MKYLPLASMFVAGLLTASAVRDIQDGSSPIFAILIAALNIACAIMFFVEKKPKQPETKPSSYYGTCKDCGSPARIDLGWTHCTNWDCTWGPKFWNVAQSECKCGCRCHNG